MKTCNKCKTEKPLDEFHNLKSSKDGKQGYCKVCEKERKQKWYEKNKSKVKKSRAKYYQDNKNIWSEYYDKLDKEEYNKKRRESYEENKIEINKKRREYRENNRDKVKVWNENYKERGNKLRNEKYNSDPIYKMNRNIRARTLNAFRVSRWDKNSSNESLLGCTYKEAFKHIESKFTEGMSWDNHTIDGWHIDHIIPLASAKTQEDLEKLCHYTNLQPLWAFDNLSKRDKY